MSDQPPTGNIPERNSREWVKNEKIINRTPEFKRARDIAEGFTPRGGATTGGKGSAQRPTNKAAYDSGWDRIFGKRND